MSEFMLHISKGQITNKRTVRNQFEGLKDGSYLVVIKSKKNRSLQQNKFWWAVLIPMVKIGLTDIGYNEVKTNKDAHEVIKALFLKKYIDNGTETALEMSGSTTDLTTIEFNELIANVQQWAAEFLNIEIPDPNQQLVLM